MTYTRIDSFDITFPDCSARPELKVCENRKHIDDRVAKKGTGEKRLYCGADKGRLNSFFGFKEEKNEEKSFFILKDDLMAYYTAIEKEYNKPTNKYKESICKIYEDYFQKLQKLSEDYLVIKFTYTYDSQNRYYLQIDRSKNNKNKESYYKCWDYIRDICLPRVTRLLFMKLEDSDGGTIFYIKPFYGAGIYSKGNVAYESKARGGQAKYRDAIFNKFKKCVVTGVSNPKLLVACHIVPYSECNASKKYDKYKYSEKNGLAMTPTIHKLFDLGYLTFSEENGKIMFSDFLFDNDRNNLHLDASASIDVADSDLHECLKWHNEHIFVRASKNLKFR